MHKPFFESLSLVTLDGRGRCPDIGNDLDMFWVFFGYAPDTFGVVLGMSWACLGHVLGLFWECFGHVLGMFWG